jgi:hypothetical protein
MEDQKGALARAAVRALIVAAATIIVGLLLFRERVFVPTSRDFQFVVCGVTGGVFYAALRASSIRNGFAALFVWYLFLTLLVGRLTLWNATLDLVYMVAVAAAVSLSFRLDRSSILRTKLQRVAGMAVFMAIANALAVLVLSLIHFQTLRAHPLTVLEYSLLNLELGTVIGIGLGGGMEIAEWALRTLKHHG